MKTLALGIQAKGQSGKQKTEHAPEQKLGEPGTVEYSLWHRYQRASDHFVCLSGSLLPPVQTFSLQVASWRLASH